MKEEKEEKEEKEVVGDEIVGGREELVDGCLLGSSLMTVKEGGWRGNVQVVVACGDVELSVMSWRGVGVSVGVVESSVVVVVESSVVVVVGLIVRVEVEVGGVVSTIFIVVVVVGVVVSDGGVVWEERPFES